MRNRILPIGLTLFSALLLVIAISWTTTSNHERIADEIGFDPASANPADVSVIESKRIPKSENPGERFEHDFMLTRDPATNTIPLDRLFEASRTITEAKRNKSSILAASMSWTERGPDDVGGRTRALMFDPNDVNDEKVWAGGVSGGLWYTDDITDSAEPWVSVDDFWSNLAVTAMAYDPTNTQVFYVATGEGFFNADAVLGGGVFKSTDGGATWAQLGSTTPALPSGNWAGVQDIVVTAAGTVLAATREGSGVQRSTDGGTSWTSVLNSTHTGSTSRAADLEIDANGDIYASMGIFSTSGIWRSLDDGQTWTQLNTGANGFPTSGMNRIEIATAPSDTNVVYALTHSSTTNGIGAIYRTSDYGANWVSMPLPADCDVATISPTDFTRGQAWYDLIAAVNPTDENDLIVGGIDLFRTANGDADSGGGAGSGATWTQISIWLNPASLGCTNSPAPPVVHADQHAIVYRPGSSTEVIFGHDGGVDYTADVTAAGLPTFVNRNNNYNVTQFYAGAINPNTGTNLMFGGTQDNGTPQLNSAGIATSFGDATGGDGGFSHLNQATNVLAMGANTGTNLHRSLNGGTTWSFIGSITGCTSSFINPSDLDDGTNELFVNCGTSSIASVTNLVSGTIGVNTLNPVGGFGATPTHLRASPFGGTSVATVYVGTNGGTIFRGTDLQDGGTQAWTTIDTTPFAGAVSISSIDFGAGEDTLLVTLSNYGVSHVWESFDGGATWNDRDGDLPDVPVRWGMYNPLNRSKVILATEVGVMETDDITASPVAWSAAAGFPTVRTDMLKYRASDETILAATHGRGLWTGEVSSLPVELAEFTSIVDGNDVVLQWKTASETSNAGFDIERALRSSSDKSQELQFESIGFVDGNGTTSEPQAYAFRIGDMLAGEYTFRLKQVDLDGSFKYSDQIEVSIELPGEALLSQAYPNPFRDETTIRLQVKKTQDVEVALYDMQGRRVATLFAGEAPANEPIEISVKSDGLASGQYIYRAIGASFIDSKTISLIK